MRLIDGDALIKAIILASNKTYNAITQYRTELTMDYLHGLDDAIQIIKDAPSADRPQGEWIEQEDDYHHYWECSECGMGVGLDDVRNFCPNCGARMKGADDETD